jgi:phospholipid/cholesterol/gamma-HCH transport system ATP-binding protein
MAAIPPHILRFAGVIIADEAHEYDVGLRDVSFEVRPGELAVILLERPRFRTPIADAASGLIAPDSGRIHFAGRDWRHWSATRASRHRGSIGRVFQGRAWVSNLDVDENILLPLRHHTSRPVRELRAEATALATRFGLSELPSVRPARATVEQLHRSACVRAFLGDPKLLLLERPEHGLYPQIMQPLILALDAARSKGAAAVWLTNLPDVFDDPALRPTARLRMQGPSLLPSADPSTATQEPK